MQYRVTWTIDIEAKTPADAAARALDIQRDPASTATFFDVYDKSGAHTRIEIDPDTGEAVS